MKPVASTPGRSQKIDGQTPRTVARTFPDTRQNFFSPALPLPSPPRMDLPLSPSEEASRGFPQLASLGHSLRRNAGPNYSPPMGTSTPRSSAHRMASL